MQTRKVVQHFTGFSKKIAWGDFHARSRTEHRWELKMGNKNADFLNLATEYVQYIIRLILKATQTLDTCACHVLLYLLNCKKKTSVE